MNIQAINTTNLNHIKTNNNQAPNPFFVGNTFSARVAGEDQGQFLMDIIGGGSFTTTFDNISPKVGDTLDFEVVSVGEQISLKLATVKAHSSINDMSAGDIKELFKKANFTGDIQETTDPNTDRENQIEIDKALKAIKNTLHQTENNLSISAVNKLLSKGIPIGQLDIAQVQISLAELEPELKANKVDSVTTALDTYDLPHTENNIKSLNKAVEIFKESSDIEDKNIALAIKQDSLTLESLYKTKYASTGYYSVKEPIQDFNNKLQELYIKQGIESTAENLTYGNLLFEQDLEITKENLEKINQLKNLDTKEAYILEQAAYNIKQGNNILDISLFNAVSSSDIGYLDLISSISELTPNHVDAVVDASLPVTLENLANADVSQNSIYTKDNIEFKKQLAEIQAKLTHEAAHKLSNKNIDINTMPIDKALAEIKAVEKEIYSKTLEKSGMNKADIVKNTETMVKLYDSLKAAKTPYYQKAILTKEISPTLYEIDQKILAEKQLKGYDAFMTVPNAKYGDSFAKVKNQLASVVENIGLEATEENIRAASILSRSQIDVDYEKMMEVKVIDKKIETIQNTLHPHIATQMLKEGINPLHMHIDQILEFIESYNNEYGDGIKDKLSQHILSIQDSLSADERSKMMAVYKTLSQITTYDKAALGINIKSGNSMTLGHLLDSANYYTKTKGKYNALDLNSEQAYDPIKKDTIRNLLAEVNQAETPENIARIENLLETIKEATPLDVTEETYKDLLLKEAAHKLTPDVLQEIDENIPLETSLKDIKDDKLERANKIMQDIAKHTQNNEKGIHLLQKSGLPASVTNLDILSKTISQPKQLRDKLNSIKDKLSKDNIDKVPENAVDYLVGDTVINVNEALEEINYTDIDLKDIKIVQSALSFQSKLSVGSYTLPVRIGGVVSTLQMKVQGGQIGNDMSVVVSLDVPRFGTVDSYMKLSNDGISLYINSEDEQNIELFKQNNDKLIEIFAENNFAINNVMYGEDFVDNPIEHYETIKDTTKNDLFKMATCLTKYLDKIS